MSSTSYKTLANLVAHIQNEIDKLQTGHLTIDELSELLEHTRELHERATVLNYLAIERRVKGEDESKQDKKEGYRLNFGISKKSPEVHPNQTNLLDAIAEQNEEYTVSDEVKEENVVEEPAVEEVEEVEEKMIEVVAEKKLEATVSISSSEETVSINDKFAKDNEELTLAEKLSQKPIDDLSKAIGLNQKFLFMNDLFEGENGAFNEAISKLNTFSGFIEAEDYINNVLAQKYNWDPTSKSVKNFTNLVKRRYQ